MSDQTRLISFLTLLLAVVIPSIALFLFDSGKDVARILFALVLVIGYGTILMRWLWPLLIRWRARRQQR